MTKNPVPGVTSELVIEKTVFGGDGLSFFNGKACFVEGALPGEKVLVQITDEKKSFFRARILQVLEPSKHRIEPLCPYTAHCGGCQYQHADYEDELRLKSAQLAEILKNISPGLKISPMVSAGKPHGYRNSVTLHPIFSKKSKGAVMGYIGKDNVSKIAVKNCLLADPRLAPVFGREFSVKKDVEKATFRLSEGGEIVNDGAEKFYRVRLGEESFLASSRGFFQANLAAASLLAQKAAVWTAEVDPRVFFDLYAGVGVFSILCARKAEKIVCIEESRESLQALRMNREERHKASIEIVEGRVEKTFPAVWERQKDASSLILLDPPRQGVTPELAVFLSKAEAAGMIYISCDPVTLARDLKLILAGGRWHIREAVPFDLFPRTQHLETAVFLTPA